MKISVSNLNKFLFFKLPSAFLCGIRVKQIDENKCVVTVKHRWINQNPFNSMYFAVQAMAAELSTGALVMLEIQKSHRKNYLYMQRRRIGSPSHPRSHQHQRRANFLDKIHWNQRKRGTSIRNGF